MGANLSSLTVLLRPKGSSIAFGIGVLLALCAWLASDPEYASVGSRGVEQISGATGPGSPPATE